MVALAHHKLGSSHKDKEIDKGRTKAKRQAGGQGVQIGGLHTTHVKKSSVHTSGSLSLQFRELFGFINVSQRQCVRSVSLCQSSPQYSAFRLSHIFSVQCSMISMFSVQCSMFRMFRMFVRSLWTSNS